MSEAARQEARQGPLMRYPRWLGMDGCALFIPIVGLLGISIWGISQPGSVSGQPFSTNLPLGLAMLLLVYMTLVARPTARTSAQGSDLDVLFILQAGTMLGLFCQQFLPLIMHPSLIPLILSSALIFGFLLVLPCVYVIWAWLRSRRAQATTEAPPRLVAWRSPWRLAAIILLTVIGALCIGKLIYDLPTLVPLAEFHSDEFIEAVAWAPDGHSLAAADDNGMLSILSTTDGHVLYSFHTCPIRDTDAMSWAPDGVRIAIQCDDSTEDIQVWDIPTRQLTLTYPGSATRHGCAWSPDGTRIATMDDHSILHIWDSTNGQDLQTIHLSEQYYETIAWAPDGHALAVGAGNGHITLVDTHAWQVNATIRDQLDSVGKVAWSPDSQRLAAADDAYTGGYAVEVISTLTGQPVTMNRGHSNSVNSLSWSPDGRYIATGSDDQTVQVWTSDAGRAVYTWHGHFDGVRSVQWSPDGRYIASGSWDHTVQVWQPDLLGA